VTRNTELFKGKSERNQEEEFQKHCKEVIALLGALDDRMEVVAERLDDLVQRCSWVWARFAGGDQAAFATRVRSEAKKDLAAIGIDMRDGVQGLRIDSETLIGTTRHLG
jgi:hypothetical protein